MQCPRAALALAAALLVPSAASAALRLEVRDLPCSPALEIAPRIEHLLAPDVPANTEVDLLVARDPDGGLRIHLQRAASVYDRRLPFERDDCTAVPHAVAAVARAWLNQSWEDVSERMADLTFPNAVATPEPPAIVVRAAAPQPLPRWRVSAAGGVSSTPAGAQVGASLGVTGEWDAPERWGVAVLGGLDTNPAAALSVATLTLRTWQLAALARVGVDLGAAGQFDLLAGPSLQVLDARLTARSVDRTLRPARAALYGMVRWREQLTSDLQLLVAVCGAARTGADDFYVLNPKADFVVPAARVGGLVGLAWMPK